MPIAEDYSYKVDTSVTCETLKLRRFSFLFAHEYFSMICILCVTSETEPLPRFSSLLHETMRPTETIAIHSRAFKPTGQNAGYDLR